MAKHGRIIAALLFACAVITVTALAEPTTESMMGQAAMMQSMMDACMANRTCMMTMMQSMMGACMANQTCMMQPARGASMANQSEYSPGQSQNASDAPSRLECTRFWLKKAVDLHELHLRDPTTTTNASQMELMDQITRAYECVTGENVTVEALNATEGRGLTGDNHGHQA